MSIERIVREREINEVLHFTTNKGCLGVLATKSLKARKQLNQDQELRYILQLNAKNRDRDAAWHDFVNLSISRINTQFFNSSGAVHKGQNFWWCILSFSPIIMGHCGVQFCTTNNMYSGVNRGRGSEGLDALFAPRVVQWHSSKKSRIIPRESTLPMSMTTCEQAEVLYPVEISTDYLQEIYVAQDSHADEAAGQMEVVGHRKVKITVKPEMFEGFK